MSASRGGNFIVELLAGRDADGACFIELGRDGGRRVWSNAEALEASARLAGALVEHGVGRGDVVMTYIGNRAEWLLTMVACFRIGAVALPCTEQLRASDLAHRLRVARPSLIVSDQRGLGEIREAGPECPVLAAPDERLFEAAVAPVAEMAYEEPALITFTSGSTGKPKAVVHGHRYLAGQRLQAQHWLAACPGEVTWCTASSGWSKSARNVFIAPWISGAVPVLFDGRFDPAGRIQVLADEGVAVLCMSPTEYRVIAADGISLPPLPSLRSLISAGERLDRSTFDRWREMTGLAIRDGYGQTETGQITGWRDGEEVRPGSMGRPLPGIRAWVEEGVLHVDPATAPTFFLGYLGEPAPQGAWRTGDLVREDEDGYLWFDSREDDIIISSGYRISPDEVEATLGLHPAVADVVAVGAPDPQRGEVVKAVIVLAEGHQPSDELKVEIQDFAKRAAAPYKYPRLIEWSETLPRTASGKLQRSLIARRPRREAA